jgi:hypothetical protein
MTHKDVVESTLPVGDTGELLDTVKVTQADGTIADREMVSIGDAANAEARANVIPSTEVAETYNLLTRSLGDKEMVDLFNNIFTELRIMNVHLSAVSNLEMNRDDLDDY